jgi:thiamine biosynthesis lipoprotein
MSTVAEISLFENNKDISAKAFTEIKRIEDEFSKFKKDSEVAKINLNNSAEVSDECIYLIKESIKYRDITDGAFDITRSSGEISILGNTVKLGKGVNIDLGGIAKGYAVDKVADLLRKNNIKKAMINLGGNLYLVGFPPGKNSWSVGVKNPENPEKLTGRIVLNKEAGISTSANYERPGHIVNPKTGKSADSVLGVTIVASTAMEADALSTGVFVLGREKGMELIEKLPEVEGIIIDKNGAFVSSGLKDKYENLH